MTTSESTIEMYENEIARLKTELSSTSVKLATTEAVLTELYLATEAWMTSYESESEERVDRALAFAAKIVAA